VSAALIRLMLQQPSSTREALLDTFRQEARYVGPERRSR
jgi:hypothetical protein